MSALLKPGRQLLVPRRRRLLIPAAPAIIPWRDPCRWRDEPRAANPSFVSGTVNSGSGLAVTSVTVSSTGSVTANDIMVVTVLPVASSGAPTGITPPAGFSTALATTRIGTSFAACAIFWKLQASGGSFSGSFSWTTSSDVTWTFSEWSGCNTTTPLDGSVQTSQNSSSTTPTSPSITPTAGNTQDTLVGVLFGSSFGVATTVAKPSAMTAAKLVNETTTIALTGVAFLALSSAGATGSEQWTLSGAQVTLGASLLLQPPAVAAFIPPRPRTRIVERRILRKVA